MIQMTLQKLRIVLACILLVSGASVHALDDAAFFADKAVGLSEGTRLTLARDSLRAAQPMIDKGESLGKALDQLLLAKAYDPDLAQVEFELGRLYESWQVGLRARALVHYEAFVKLRPRDSRGLTHLANLYGWLGRLEEADATFRLALAAETKNASWVKYQYSGFLVAYTDRYTEAHELAQDAIESMPLQDRENDPWPWRNKGMALAREGVRKDQARSDLEKARSIFQKYNDTWQVSYIDVALEELK